MPDHPQYVMWKVRHEAELAADRERAARRAQREVAHIGLAEAWHEYKVHWRSGLVRERIVWPPWHDLRAWLRLLLGKDRTSTVATLVAYWSLSYRDR